jgi:hypothetical protein
VIVPSSLKLRRLTVIYGLIAVILKLERFEGRYWDLVLTMFHLNANQWELCLIRKIDRQSYTWILSSIMKTNISHKLTTSLSKELWKLMKFERGGYSHVGVYRSSTEIRKKIDPDFKTKIW